MTLANAKGKGTYNRHNNNIIVQGSLTIITYKLQLSKYFYSTGHWFHICGLGRN
jgi:hypothetical protein